MIKRFLRWLWCPGPCRFEIIREVRGFDDDALDMLRKLEELNEKHAAYMAAEHPLEG